MCRGWGGGVQLKAFTQRVCALRRLESSSVLELHGNANGKEDESYQEALER